MKSEIGPYSPCPCGSGRKYKFCCYLKAKEASASAGLFTTAGSTGFRMKTQRVTRADDRIDEGLALLTTGVRQMNAGNYDDAIKIFKQYSAA
ncbi:MAG: SEC-C metal-binding domain-containing protein [Kiritimatiellae bacterium]|nr:SEC-C metal-binding domain-containing protein [Kiritimatiellia bacterium]